MKINFPETTNDDRKFNKSEAKKNWNGFYRTWIHTYEAKQREERY